jgi:hypothetical protein
MHTREALQLLGAAVLGAALLVACGNSSELAPTPVISATVQSPATVPPGFITAPTPVGQPSTVSAPTPGTSATPAGGLPPSSPAPAAT